MLRPKTLTFGLLRDKISRIEILKTGFSSTLIDYFRHTLKLHHLVDILKSGYTCASPVAKESSAAHNLRCASTCCCCCVGCCCYLDFHYEKLIDAGIEKKAALNTYRYCCHCGWSTFNVPHRVFPCCFLSCLSPWARTYAFRGSPSFSTKTARFAASNQQMKLHSLWLWCKGLDANEEKSFIILTDLFAEFSPLLCHQGQSEQRL